MMDSLCYIYGSGILVHPARWEILGMTVAIVIFIVVMVWWVWVCLNDVTPVPDRRQKAIVGFILLLLLWYIISQLTIRYHEVIRRDTPSSSPVPSPVCWVCHEDSTGIVWIYDNIVTGQ